MKPLNADRILGNTLTLLREAHPHFEMSARETVIAGALLTALVDVMRLSEDVLGGGEGQNTTGMYVGGVSSSHLGAGGGSSLDAPLMQSASTFAFDHQDRNYSVGACRTSDSRRVRVGVVALGREHSLVLNAADAVAFAHNLLRIAGETVP